MTNAPVIWTPLPKQALALSCPVEDILFGGAVGGGKTDFLLAAFVKHANDWGTDAIGLIVRRTLPELRDIIRRSKNMFPQLGAKYLSSDKTWTFPNGAILIFGYLENDEDATRYQGQEYTFFGVDEAGAFKSPDPIDYLRSRLRSTNDAVPKKLIMTANPGGRGHQWLVDRYIKPSKPMIPFIDHEAGGIQRVYIPSKLTDNPYLMKDKTYIQRLKGSGPSWLVRALLNGDWNIAINGKVFPRENWMRYHANPADCAYKIQSWDTAFKTGQDNDRSVCTTWAWVPRTGFYLLDMWAGKLEPFQLVGKAKEMAQKWDCYTVLIEDAASGQAIIPELRKQSDLAVIPVKPKGDKVSRAWQATPLIESGKVFIPAKADWLEDFLLETAGFPQLAHDDVVDSVSQALNYLGAKFSVGADPAMKLFEPVQPVVTRPSLDSAIKSNTLYANDEEDSFYSERASPLL